MPTQKQISASIAAHLASIESKLDRVLAAPTPLPDPAPAPQPEPAPAPPPVPTPGIARTAADLVASRIVPPYNAKNVRGVNSASPVVKFKPGVWPGMVLMGGTGERSEIGPVTDPIGEWLCGGSFENMIAWAMSHSALPVHHRIDGKRVDFNKYPRASCYTSNNVGADPLLTIDSPYTAEQGHYPGCEFVPYLATGDGFYLEELKDAATFHLLNMNPDYRGEAKGLIERGQVRSYAWGLRDIASVVLATDDPYWKAILANNCQRFNEMWVRSDDPINKMGFSTDDYAHSTDGSRPVAPWQHDFLCFVLGWMIWTGKFPEWRENYEWSCRNLLMRANGTGGFPRSRGLGYWWNTGNVTDGASLAAANPGDLTPTATGKLLVTDTYYGAYMRGALKMAVLNNVADAQASFDWIDPQILWVPPKWAV